MFYSQFILAKKGPLGTIWIAAHLERKLRKNQVADTDIGVSVDSILSPDVPIALRLSSHLLLGVVRIYSRKVSYLFDDCSDALLKVKQAFRSAAVDLPPEESKAPYHSITLPETFDLDDFELPENEIFQGNFVDHHVSSREQITLQDTMEGVSYSTSKFGLDERFGDGDTSGLDLDEELFLDKIGTGGHGNESADPQASVGLMASLKQDELPESRTDNSGTRVGDDDNADLMDYAEGPCTPGLVEEPNLSNVQEISACDDHMESEYHLVETITKENAKNITYEEKQEVDWCSHDNMNSDAIPMLLTEGNLSKPEGESPIEAKLEHVTMDESSLGQVKTLNPALESVDKVIEASDVHCMEDLQNGDANKDNNSSVPVDKPCHDHKCPDEIGLEKSECEISGLTSACQQLSEGISVKDQEIASDQEKSCVDGYFPQNPESRACPEWSSLSLDGHEKVVSNETLRPCNSNVEHHGITSEYALVTDADVQSDVAALATSGREETVMLGEAHRVTDNSEFGKENQIEDRASEKNIHAASDGPDSQVHHANSHDGHVEHLNNSAEAELPAPEKLLSVPEGLGDLHRDMLVDGSPGEFPGLDEGDAGSKIVSGKKRSFTESTLTEQSLNSVESSRLVRFKRTVESVPDDDDLLSSILVGRSSVLKVKPTPRLSEVTSVKRTRSAQRTGPPKRKVLMDDTMVLHGDTIRQQLMNTEDIRRVRKKAPCTLPEISMIKKQHLEDEIFLEPMFTGISTEFASLHHEMRDLSGITVCKDDPNSASLEIVAEVTTLPSPNDKNGIQTTAKPLPSSRDVKTDDSLAIASGPHLPSQDAENAESLNIENDDGSIRRNATEQSGNRITGELLLGRNDDEVAETRENPVLIDTRMDPVLIDTRMDPVLIDTRTEELDQTNIETNKELLLDVTGVETSQRNDDAVNDDTSARVVADAAALPVEKTDLPSAELDSTRIDGDIDCTVETQPILRDDVLPDMTQDGGSVELLSNEHGEVHSVILGEHIVASPYPAEVGQQDDGFMNNGEPQQAYERYTMDAGSSGFDLHDQEELQYSAAGNDAEFLNFDDDDLTEMADDHVPDDEEARFAENTGWSSRTRAVSKYLQTLFVKEADSGRKSLSTDNLLVGKSRKEASRMFFETLVLKTRDYIHVEQPNPFGDITIKPRSRLLKSEF